jgi:hypothetical protein
VGEEPVVKSERLTVNSEQLTVNGQPATGNWQPATGNWLVNALAIVALAGGLVIAVGAWLSRLVYPQIEPLVERLFLGLALATTAFDGARAFYSYQYQQVMLLGLALLGTGVVLWLSQRPFSLRLPLLGKRPLYLLLAPIVICWTCSSPIAASTPP